MSKRFKKSEAKHFKKSRSRAGRRAARNKFTGKKFKNTIQGTISISPSGFGFVSPKDGGEDIFIPIKFTNSALDGDTVEIIKLPPRKDDKERNLGPAGKVVEVVERARLSLVGQLLSGHKVRPLNKRIVDDIQVKGSLCGAKRGDWVEIYLNPPEDRFGEFSGVLKKKFGKAGTINADLDAVTAEYELLPPYTAEQEEAAGNLKPREIERRDLTNLFCVTIDPFDAKDYDDAVSLAPGDNENEIKIGVHIADVAAWIKPGSTFDREAKKRAFTAYLPGRTLPMLPRNLTAKISLSPDGHSLAHSVILTVDTTNGKVKYSERFHSKIQLTKRMSFDEVQSYIDTQKIPEDWDDYIAKNIDKLIEITALMRRYRKRHEKFLELETTEIRVLCDEENDQIIGLQRKEQKEADKLIEDCMLAANSEVAKELINAHIPGLFRTHPEPEPEKLEEFAALMAGSFHLSTGDLSSRAACNFFLESLEDNPRKPIIINSFIRTMPRAVYEHEPAIHFGLGKGRYSHFTSPIRRYSDLLVHQQLWTAEVNGRLKSKITFEKLATEISAREEKNESAYYAANDRLKLRYLDEQLSLDETPKIQEGLIVKITARGMLINVQSLGIYGFTPYELLPRDFIFYPEKSLLSSHIRKMHFKAGDFIFLHLRGIDYAKGSAIMRPVL